MTKSLSVNRDALLDLDGVSGRDALSDVALLRGLGARGGDDLLATLSDGGILKHIHHSLADLPGSLNSPWDTFLHRGAHTGRSAHTSCNTNKTDGATDGDGASKTDATAGEEKPSCLRFSLGSSSSKAGAKKNNCEFHF